MTDETDGDECGESVADDAEVEFGEPFLREGGEFKGELHDVAPGLIFGAESAGEGAHGEDGNGECFIFPVAFDNGVDECGDIG